MTWIIKHIKYAQFQLTTFTEWYVFYSVKKYQELMIRQWYLWRKVNHSGSVLALRLGTSDCGIDLNPQRHRFLGFSSQLEKPSSMQSKHNLGAVFVVNPKLLQLGPYYYSSEQQLKALYFFPNSMFVKKLPFFPSLHAVIFLITVCSRSNTIRFRVHCLELTMHLLEDKSITGQ